MELLKDEMSSRGTVSLEMADVHPDTAADAMSQEPADMDDLKLEDIVTALANRIARTKLESEAPEEVPKQPENLPKHIMFPYSRHSSYGELCSLIEAFKPEDIFPCTVVPEKHWRPNHSMAYLFGHLYIDPPKFRHDQTMLRKMSERPAPAKSPPVQKEMRTPEISTSPGTLPPTSSTPSKTTSKRKLLAESQEHLEERTHSKQKMTDDPPQTVEESTNDDDSETDEEMDSAELKNAFRIEASDAALGNFGKHWSTVGLVSVSGHQEKEEEL